MQQCCSFSCHFVATQTSNRFHSKCPQFAKCERMWSFFRPQVHGPTACLCIFLWHCCAVKMLLDKYKKNVVKEILLMSATFTANLHSLVNIPTGHKWQPDTTSNNCHFCCIFLCYSFCYREEKICVFSPKEKNACNNTFFLRGVRRNINILIVVWGVALQLPQCVAGRKSFR